MKSHTPGPWSVDTRHYVHAIVCSPTRPGEFPEVAFVERHGHPDHGSITARRRTDEELAANAALLAAAPDMLKAIRAAYGHLNTYGVVSGVGTERERDSQSRVFDLLRPFVHPGLE